MTEIRRDFRESFPDDPDDIDAYVAAFSDEEQEELAAADAAIDIAMLLHRAREHRGLPQGAAARRASLQQQAVSRFERPGANPRLETITKYLNALGFTLELHLIDRDTGETAASATLTANVRARSA